MDFQQAGEQFKQLRARLDSGQLTEADFKAKLQDLMVQDEQGAWWMIGQATGQWYRHDGTGWVRADPPAVKPRPSIEHIEPVRRKVRPGWITVLWITLGWAVAVSAVVLLLFMLGVKRWPPRLPPLAFLIWWAAYGYGVMPASASMFLLGSLAGLLAAIALRIGGAISHWKTVLWITLGWAICMALGASLATMTPVVRALTSAMGAMARDIFISAGIMVLGGVLGGLGMALILRFTGVLSNWKDVLWIALGWALPGLASAIIQRPPMSTSIILFVIGAAVASFILVWRLRQENRPRARSVSI
jgi:hypothetical protein